MKPKAEDRVIKTPFPKGVDAEGVGGFLLRVF